tara:strand:+ start:524 stop:1015 length:492 start_codon:yes stop_codon:yes gene_type:complete
MSKAKTHWKNNFDYQYLGGYSIEGDDLELTIVEVKNEMVKGQSGRDESCMVIYFEEVDKGMICNKTNAKTITTVHGTPYIEEWTGKKILLGTEKVSAFGETTDALRIRQIKPKTKIDPSQAVATLKGALDLADLQSIWKSLSKAEQQDKTIINTKNTMKNELN